MVSYLNGKQEMAPWESSSWKWEEELSRDIISEEGPHSMWCCSLKHYFKAQCYQTFKEVPNMKEEDAQMCIHTHTNPHTYSHAICANIKWVICGWEDAERECIFRKWDCYIQRNMRHY